MFQKAIKQFLFTTLLLSSAQTVIAQEKNSYEPGQEYILADIDVKGKVNFNKETVVTFTGLQKGQKLTVPSEEISSAIKKLWKLGLFSDVNFYVSKVQNDSIYLELDINELPKLNEVKFVGVKKSKADTYKKDTDLKTGKVVNENLINTSKNYITNKLKSDGYYNTKVNISTHPDSTNNTVNMTVLVDRGEKVKISEINFTGNQNLTDKKLRKAMSGTKKKSFLNPIRIFKPSKYVPEKYQEDLVNIIETYKENGFRDARILEENVTFEPEKNTVKVDISLEEGRKYYFGNIRFIGNTVYTEDQLKRVLGIEKGEVYNGKMLQNRISDKKNPDANDITNLYQNYGYIFSNVNAIETKTQNDTIDFDIRIVEGPLAYINSVKVTGNDKTNDHVIYRELRTRPGDKWSKENVVRTIRELGQLGFFDPEALQPDIKPNPSDGTVDISYKVVEKGASQVELQGGYGGGSFIGTLGLSFNNFSARNIFNRKAYQPLPMGDGQKMALRAQFSKYYQTYSLSFTEPWLGGKKPLSFSASVSHSKQFLYNYYTYDVDRSQSFNITTLSFGLAKRLNVPDDYFVLSQAVSYQYFDLNNYNTGLFTFGNGQANNLAYTVSLSRNSKGKNPIFPEYGSEFTVSAKLTPPYSMFDGVDYKNLENQEEYKRVTTANTTTTNGQYVPAGTYLDANGNAVPNNDYTLAAVDQGKIDQKRFKLLEYYKLKFKGDWYTTLTRIGDQPLVLRTLGEFGFMGAYNNARGLVPFERFYLGGDGMANFTMDGREIVQLRGYDNYALTPLNANGEQIGGTIYNKFTLEMRYPITLKQSASIYALAFAEAGTSYANFKDYNPFSLKRSTGLGLRVFMPMFGLLGIDFAYGYDNAPGTTQPSGWQTHFIIGQQF